MKDFDAWNIKKQTLDQRDVPPLFHTAQVWWCSVGINVGFEILGKSGLYTRPVLVLRKYSKHTFFALPMTSKQKKFPAYVPISFQGKQVSVILDQGRTLDARRLANKTGELPGIMFKNIRQLFIEYHT